MASGDEPDFPALERQMAALEQRVITLMAAVQDAQRLGALGVLAATVAHEINNVLTPIQGYARSALARPDDAALGRRALERAAEGAERGAQIARSVLALAGESVLPESGGVTATPVGGAVAEAVELARLASDRAGVRVEVDIEAGIRAQIARVGLVQVVQNLLLNAAGAMRERGGTVRIGASGVDVAGDRNAESAGSDHGSPDALPGSGWVELLVSDDGPGIAESVRERLFKPFATAAASKGGTAVGGSGLGLSICKGLIEAAGGRIEVRTMIGCGTTFRVLLPAAAEETA